jgi:hypothetical protein
VSHPPGERRANRELREVLDDLVDHVRQVARGIHAMSQEDLTYAQERLEWLAEEVWRAAVEKKEAP